MEPTIIYIIIGVAALIIGLIIGKLVFAKNTDKKGAGSRDSVSETNSRIPIKS